MVSAIVSGSERGWQWPFNESEHKERASLFKQLLKNEAFSQGIDQGAGVDILYEYTLFPSLSSQAPLQPLYTRGAELKRKSVIQHKFSSRFI